MEDKKREMIDFIVRAQTGFKVRRNSKEYIARFNSLSRKDIKEIIKIYLVY